jgi:hypothetical protein
VTDGEQFKRLRLGMQPPMIQQHLADLSPWSVSVAGHNPSVFCDTPAVLMALTRHYPAVTIGVALTTPARDQFALPTK